MCSPRCRDPRPQPAGTALRTAALAERKKLTPAQMSAYLTDVYGVDRFLDLCYSHATGIVDGLDRGILADAIALYPTDVVE